MEREREKPGLAGEEVAKWPDALPKPAQKGDLALISHER